MANIGLSFIKYLNSTPQNEKKDFYWDNILIGFGLRIRNQTMSYVVKYRNQFGKQRLLTIGRVGKITPEEARTIAKDKLAEIVKGNDPAKDKQANKKSLNIAELCDWYMQEGTSHKKASTLQIDKGRIERHIKPLIGNDIVKNITRGDIEKLMFDIISGNKIQKHEKSQNKRGTVKVTGGKTAASRTVQLLGAIFEFARHRDIIQINPAHGVKKPKEKAKNTFLTIEEIRTFGQVLDRDDIQTLYSKAVNCLKLLLFTGCRKTEILSLKWEYIDFKNQCFRFLDTKTGKQTRAFGLEALYLLQELKNNKSNSEWVFPANTGAGHYIGLPRAFNYIKQAKNDKEELLIKQDITIHSLRHTFASLAADMGYTEFTIAGLLGHRLRGVTNRYSHAVDKSLVNAADSISLRIAQALRNETEQTAKLINIAREA